MIYGQKRLFTILPGDDRIYTWKYWEAVDRYWNEKEGVSFERAKELAARDTESPQRSAV